MAVEVGSGSWGRWTPGAGTHRRRLFALNTSTESSKKTRSRVVYEDSVEVCGGKWCGGGAGVSGGVGRVVSVEWLGTARLGPPAYTSMATMNLVRAAMTHAVTNM